VTILQPKKKPRGAELTDEEKEHNRQISHIRIQVEHAIGGVKRYRIVKDRLRNWKQGFRDQVMETCCGLHNFRLNFRSWSYFSLAISQGVHELSCATILIRRVEALMGYSWQARNAIPEGVVL